jgi:hypothetical protein
MAGGAGVAAAARFARAAARGAPVGVIAAGVRRTAPATVRPLAATLIEAATRHADVVAAARVVVRAADAVDTAGLPSAAAVAATAASRDAGALPLRARVPVGHARRDIAALIAAAAAVADGALAARLSRPAAGGAPPGVGVARRSRCGTEVRTVALRVPRTAILSRAPAAASSADTASTCAHRRQPAARRGRCRAGTADAAAAGGTGGVGAAGLAGAATGDHRPAAADLARPQVSAAPHAAVGGAAAATAARIASATRSSGHAADHAGARGALTATRAGPLVSDTDVRPSVAAARPIARVARTAGFTRPATTLAHASAATDEIAGSARVAGTTGLAGPAAGHARDAAADRATLRTRATRAAGLGECAAPAAAAPVTRAPDRTCRAVAGTDVAHAAAAPGARAGLATGLARTAAERTDTVAAALAHGVCTADSACTAGQSCTAAIAAEAVDARARVAGCSWTASLTQRAAGARAVNRAGIHRPSVVDAGVNGASRARTSTC